MTLSGAFGADAPAPGSHFHHLGHGRVCTTDAPGTRLEALHLPGVAASLQSELCAPPLVQRSATALRQDTAGIRGCHARTRLRLWGFLCVETVTLNGA
ncbi:g572 [Coccomyxa elongata]